MRESEHQRLLLVVGGTHRVGLPIVCVRETMRPLPLSPLRDAPSFVLGMAVIRGASVPVVDLGALLGRGAEPAQFRRFVTLDVDGRAVALAVEDVAQVVELTPDAFAALPPLFAHAAGDAIERLAVNDAGLLLVLRATRLVPETALASEAP